MPAPETRRRLSGELLLALLTLLWGTSFVIIKNAQHSISAGTLVFFRFAVASIVLAPFLRRGAKLWLAGLQLGFWLWAGFLTQAIGLRYTTTGRSAFITCLSVIFVPMLAALSGRRIPLLTWLAAAIAFAGAALLCFDGSPANVGDLWTLACALTFAVFIVRLERDAARFPVLPLTVIQLLTVAALSSPWFARDWAMAARPQIPWPSIIYLALVCTALTTCLQTVGQRYVPAPQATIIFMLEPVFASIFGYIHLGERMGWRGATGSSLILAATLLSQLPMFLRRNHESRIPEVARAASP